jgi:hypothetical protein
MAIAMSLAIAAQQVALYTSIRMCFKCNQNLMALISLAHLITPSKPQRAFTFTILKVKTEAEVKLAPAAAKIVTAAVAVMDGYYQRYYYCYYHYSDLF